MNIKENFSQENYDKMLEELFVRFPSFQNTGSGAYKPGLDRMEFFDALAGHPHRKYTTIHIAGTNGKGSVTNIIAAILANTGLNVGIYTSPHISDFRERIRIIYGSKAHPGELHDGSCTEYIPQQDVWDFIYKWNESFEHLELSFFEITTAMAFSWFADRNIDIAIIESGLGGRLDSTNIISPVLSVITNIGLDHCDLLGESLAEIAFEKAGIIKQGTPAVIGESNPETDTVFERKVLYSNLSSSDFMSDRSRIMTLIKFADKTLPSYWEDHKILLQSMDLQGEYQKKNLRTALCAIDTYMELPSTSKEIQNRLKQTQLVENAIIHTAAITQFHGRWEKLSDDPITICDIGHNAHGLKYNFNQLEEMLTHGDCTSLTIIYGIVADKDLDSILPLMPKNATYIFTNSSGKRALPANKLEERFREYINETGKAQVETFCHPTVQEAILAAKEYISTKADSKPLIYIGGSTFVVAEAVDYLKNL